MAASFVQLGDDVRDRLADARNFGEPAFLDQQVERNGEGGQAVRRTRVGLGPVWIAAAQRAPLRVFTQQSRDLLRIGHRHTDCRTVSRTSSRDGRP